MKDINEAKKFIKKSQTFKGVEFLGEIETGEEVYYLLTGYEGTQETIRLPNYCITKVGKARFTNYEEVMLFMRKFG